MTILENEPEPGEEKWSGTEMWYRLRTLTYSRTLYLFLAKR